MFKNLIVYKMGENFTVEIDKLKESINEFKFINCTPNDIKAVGWVSPMKGSDELLYTSNGQSLVKILTEDKILPSSVVKEEVENKIERFEEREGRKPKKAEKDTFKDEVIQELLPRAFSKYSETVIWISNDKGLIFVEAGSAKKAEDALALLRKTLGSLPVSPFTPETPIDQNLTRWLKEKEIPENFNILDEAELKSSLEGGIITSKKEDLFNDEIQQHLEAGKVVTKLYLMWKEEISFVITDEGFIKKIKLSDKIKEQNSDISKEDKAQRFDADFVLFTGTILEMFLDLEKSFLQSDSE